MKTTKEFMDVIRNDQDLAKEISDKVFARMNEGEENPRNALIPIAAEYGYELNEEELDEIYTSQAAELSEEELGKVSGGTVFSTLLITFFSSMLASASLSGATVYLTIKENP